jgi:quinol monooxygenase YgiN
VHRDVERPLHLVFLEHWTDTEALRTHFRAPESGAFVTEVTPLAAGRPEMTIYTAEVTTV